MLGSLVGVSLIAAHLGAGARGQIFAVLACATLRMGILQAAGTQNDYVTAFWLVCMTEALLATAPAVVSPWGALRVGAALGLAMLTKGTAVLFAAPLLLALWPWRQRLSDSHAAERALRRPRRRGAERSPLGAEPRDLRVAARTRELGLGDRHGRRLAQ